MIGNSYCLADPSQLKLFHADLIPNNCIFIINFMIPKGLRRRVNFENSYRMKPLNGLLLLLSICISCSKEEGDYEPYLLGNIVGFAMLTDQYGNMPDDHSGINVYVEPGRRYSGKTDYRGRFEIKGVPTGTYNLSFEKTGYGIMKYPEVHHLGGKATVLGIPSTEFPYNSRIFLHQDITAKLSNIAIEGNFIRVSSTYSGDYMYIRLFMSTTHGFSSENAQYAYNQSTNYPPVYFDLSELPLESGTTIYCRASLFTSGAILDYNLYMLGSLIPIDNYTDSNGDTVYPNLTEESDEYAFIIP